MLKTLAGGFGLPAEIDGIDHLERAVWWKAEINGKANVTAKEVDEAFKCEASPDIGAVAAFGDSMNEVMNATDFVQSWAFGFLHKLARGERRAE